MRKNTALLIDRILDASEIFVAVVILLLQLSFLVWYFATIIIAVSLR